MLDLYDIIRKIEKRPAMYLGQPSITHLQSFLAGYFFARHQLGEVETEQEKQFANFDPWIQEKFKITSSQSWDKIILFFSQDERQALDLFFELFNEFARVDDNVEIPGLTHSIHR
ncbi:hypothetical protein AM228_25370 [Planktothricoides sp. SR001]|uniref:hypothetical protein n=1 Tax=Planktothricoides sp. SR001 TaxID=1705388 RepID=UPI0006C305C8|nr:hypothetical protein [Planktothricoides sp. SR001]KOR34205.1 hypothetical protein AM228_25370 [Planktothricoides sp. SR001]